jgi:hypothetical protein
VKIVSRPIRARPFARKCVLAYTWSDRIRTLPISAYSLKPASWPPLGPWTREQALRIDMFAGALGNSVLLRHIVPAMEVVEFAGDLMIRADACGRSGGRRREPSLEVAHGASTACWTVARLVSGGVVREEGALLYRVAETAGETLDGRSPWAVSTVGFGSLISAARAVAGCSAMG